MLLLQLAILGLIVGVFVPIIVTNYIKQSKKYRDRQK